jgi:biotin transport system ATP-binding protein
MATIVLDAAEVTVPGAADARVSRTLLAPTSVTLREHRIGIIGPNGSGKSTLARLVNGLVRPSSGRVLVDGVDVSRHGGAVRRRVGFCFTDPSAQLVMPTVVEDVELSLRHRIRERGPRRAAALDVLRGYGLDVLAHQSVHALSGGQKQLLALASVLAAEPSVLVADEPTTLLDLVNTRRVAQILFSTAAQLVLVTHDLDLALRCDRVLVVDGGRVTVDDAPRGAIESYLSLADPRAAAPAGADASRVDTSHDR